MQNFRGAITSAVESPYACEANASVFKYTQDEKKRYVTIYDNCQVGIIDSNHCTQVLPSRDDSLLECCFFEVSCILTGHYQILWMITSACCHRRREEMSVLCVY